MFLGNILDIFALKTYDIAKEKRYLKIKKQGWSNGEHSYSIIK